MKRNYNKSQHCGGGRRYITDTPREIFSESHAVDVAIAQAAFDVKHLPKHPPGWKGPCLSG